MRRMVLESHASNGTGELVISPLAKLYATAYLRQIPIVDLFYFLLKVRMLLREIVALRLGGGPRVELFRYPR